MGSSRRLSLAKPHGKKRGPHGPRPRSLRRGFRLPRLRRAFDRGAGGARAGAQAPGHVHRRHRRAGAAPPRRRGARQCHGRGGRRPRHPHRGRALGRLRGDGARQRPRHPGRPASAVSGQVGARGHPLHAARRRQVLGQGLSDERWAARRRRVGGQRALGPAGGRGGAQPAALAPGIFARPPGGKARVARGGAEPARDQRDLPPGPRDFRRVGALQADAPAEDGALEGLPFLGRRNPLEVRPGLPGGGRRHPGGGDLPLPRRALRLSGGAARRRAVLRRPRLRRPRRLRRAVRGGDRRLGRMGGELDAAARRLRLLLLQHHPDAGGGNPRAGVLGGDPQGHPRLRRAGLEPQGGAGQPRGRDGRRLGDDLGLHPRAGVRRADQGPAGVAGGGAAGRERGQGPVRPLAGGRYADGRGDPRLPRAEGRGADAAAGREGDEPQDRGQEAAAAGQARRLLGDGDRRVGAVPGRGRLRPGARRSRRATASSRRCCRSGARS